PPPPFFFLFLFHPSLFFPFFPSFFFSPFLFFFPVWLWLPCESLSSGNSLGRRASECPPPSPPAPLCTRYLTRGLCRDKARLCVSACTRVLPDIAALEGFFRAGAMLLATKARWLRRPPARTLLAQHALGLARKPQHMSRPAAAISPG
ncbi:unnamed protein product, partial [Ixodes pacificus]